MRAFVGWSICFAIGCATPTGSSPCSTTESDAETVVDGSASLDAGVDEAWPEPTRAVPPVPLIRAVPGAVFGHPYQCETAISFARDPATGAEAGFVDVFGERMFYSYRPHSGTDPEAPLVVIFNGGPGAPTTNALMSTGTAPRTVVWERRALEAPIDNPASWTRFGHLLYLDAPSAGYSYSNLSLEARSAVSIGQTIVGDAAAFVSTVLWFLDCRADRPDRRVVLVGESYGGVRAPIMLWHLHHPPDSDRALDLVGDERMRFELRWQIERHFSRIAFGRGEAEPFSSASVARQFFGQFLIQPAVGWMGSEPFQFEFQEGEAAELRLAQLDPARFAPIDVAANEARRSSAVMDRDESYQMFGVRLEEIPWMSPVVRMFGGLRCDPEAADENYLVSVLGPLDDCEHYYGRGYWSEDNYDLAVYPESFRWTATLITDAVEDAIVITPAIPEGLTHFAAIRRGRLRADWMDLQLLDGAYVSIRMPRFQAGHMVPEYQPVEIADVFERWLAELTGS